MIVIAVVGVEMDRVHLAARRGGGGDRVAVGLEPVVRGEHEERPAGQPRRVRAPVPALPVRGCLQAIMN